MVTLEVEVAEEMEVLAKEENRTLTNWIATAALMELKRRKAVQSKVTVSTLDESDVFPIAETACCCWDVMGDTEQTTESGSRIRRPLRSVSS